MGRPKLSQSLLFVALASPMALGGCAMTSTYGTGQAPEMALFREMTGGLLSKEKKGPIDYQPRAPLVLPPSGEQLPAPVETASITNPDWPVDSEDRAIMHDDGDGNPDNDITREDYRRLKPLAGILSPGTHPTPAQNDLQAERDEYYRFVRQGSHREEFAKAVAETKGYTRKERRYLTDPPEELREPADTAPVAEVEDGVKKRRLLWRLFPGS